MGHMPMETQRGMRWPTGTRTGSGQPKPSNDPRSHQYNPPCADYRAPLPRPRHHKHFAGTDTPK